MTTYDNGFDGYEPTSDDIAAYCEHLQALEIRKSLTYTRDPWEESDFDSRHARAGDPRLKWHRDYVEKGFSIGDYRSVAKALSELDRQQCLDSLIIAGACHTGMTASEILDWIDLHMEGRSSAEVVALFLATRAPDPDPLVSLTKEGPFWAPVYVFTRKSGQRLEFNSKEYAELVNSQR